MNNHYHFVGIGGIGMGALASLVLAKGHRVSGSDLRKNQITSRLEKQGAQISIGHDPLNIEGAECLIYSSAIDENNPELKAALRKGIEVLQRAELLADLMDEHIGITVAGAHGKTTTTSMLSHLLTDANLQPTTAIGGIVNAISTNAQLGSGQYFLAEVDESDGSFLYFSPKYSVITNIDFEHVDYYQNWDNILNAYREFIDKTSSDGMIFAFGGDERLLRLLKAQKRPFKTYGFAPHNEIIAKNLTYNQMSISFDCLVKDKKLGKIILPMPGKHNVLNALATIAVGLELSIKFETIIQSLNDYSGVQRRFQLLTKFDDIWVVDDYAHHPTEIKMTIEAAKCLKRNRVITIVQPHRYSRVKCLGKEFALSLKESDHILITDIYAASEQPIEGISAEILNQQIQEITGKDSIYVEKNNIVEYLRDIVKPGDLILTLGAGDITHIADDIVESLKSLKQHSTEIVSENLS